MSDSDSRSLSLRASVVTIGSFDGVHRGHQAIVRVAVQRAQELGIPAVAITFDRHPQESVQPDNAPAYLTTLTSRLRLLLENGVQDVLVLRFDREFATLHPEAFLQSVLQRRLNARRIVVGRDFRFGHQRMGSVEYLQAVQARFGFEVEAVPDVLYRGERISSSRIRQALLEGEVQEASAMLGRAYALEGVVVRGQQIGRKLGYPTVNLSLHAPQLVPRDGIYAGRLLHERTGNLYTAAISVGVRPTVDGTGRTIEAYLLGFSGSLYGEQVHLAFFHRLRDERKFETLHALKAQMDRDVQQVANLMR
ncbi:MAG: bifunctional riboflavin kinase/FAD synthetase [Armatimonadota bacterium]|nr:bifunctional riboflavin kinase/FAD synthetase [bacterium]MDW8321553.1 bifunctional riboflavin kinase/FAD synthetase [Armatimonadota bacterium]